MKGVITRGIFFGILILFVLHNPQGYIDGSITQQTESGWSNYQAISDIEEANPYPIMLYDNNEMTFILWRSSNETTFKSTFNYRIMFNNGTLTDTKIIAEFSYGTPYTYLTVNTHVAAIDHLNRFNFLYYDRTKGDFVHVRYEDHSWVKISEVNIPYYAICLMNDKDNNLRLIYRVRGIDVDNFSERIFNGETWSEPNQITSHEKSVDTRVIIAYATDFASGKEGEIAIVYHYYESYTNDSNRVLYHCLIYKNSWQSEIIAQYGMYTNPTCEFDDTGALHIVYGHESVVYELYYQTYQNSWSETTKLSVTWPLNFGYIDLSICGSSIFLLNAIINPISSAPAGETSIYTIQNNTIEMVDLVYTSDETVPVKGSAGLAMPNGNFYVLTNEYDQEMPRTYTLFFGDKMNLFTFQVTTIMISWHVFWVGLIILPVLAFSKKRKRSN